jgi:hypothetical protein
MIEKIDRPEAPPPYRIGQAKQTAEDRHQQHNPREDAEREQRRQIEGKEWSKFGRRTTTIKPLRVAREKIARCSYRASNLHSGIATMQVDIAWADGRVTRGALMLITKLEDFMNVRKLTPGQEVPESIWAKGTTVEMGIPQTVAEPGAPPGREIGRDWGPPAAAAVPKVPILVRMGVVAGDPPRVNWGMALMYLFVIALAVFAVIAIAF